MTDPRGERADAGQGENGVDGGPVACHICGEEMSGHCIPDHLVEEHAPTEADDA